MSPCLLVAMWCWYLGPGSGLTRVPHCTGAGAGVRPGPGEGRCPLASLCTVTHYAILRRETVKYSNDICDILPQNSWETSTFYIERWQSWFPYSFRSLESHLFDWLVCANKLANYDSSDLNLYSRGLTSAGNKGNVRHHIILTWLTMNQKRKAKIRLTFPCTLWWIEITNTSTDLLLFKCEQNAKSIIPHTHMNFKLFSFYLND